MSYNIQENNKIIPTVKSINSGSFIEFNTDEAVCGGKTDTSNINLNSTLKIKYTDYKVTLPLTHSNAYIFLKDNNSSGYGDFYPISINSYGGRPNLIYNSNIVIDTGNLEQEIEDIFNERALDLSSITITGNCSNPSTINLGYLNFSPTGTSIPSGTGGVGFRYEPSTSNLQFATDPGQWFSFDSLLNAAYFRNLLDVSINSVSTRQYIVADTIISGNATYINSNLSIFDDPTPKLSSNLNINSFGIVNNGGGYIVKPTDNTSDNSITNYINLQNSTTGQPVIISPNGIDTITDIKIASKNNGDILLTSDNGNVVAECKSLYNYGYYRVSTYYTSTNTNNNYTTGPFFPGNISYNLPISSDTVIFDFNSSSPIGTYTANISAGSDDGQILNLIFYWTTPQEPPNDIKIIVDFGSNKLGIGDKFGSRILFNTPGQSASLIYINGGLISTNGLWQLRNTGAYVE